MTHDKFCDLDGNCEDYDTGTAIAHDIIERGRTRTEYCQRCEHNCTCVYLARVRADERKKLSDKLNNLPSLVVNDEIVLSLDDFASLIEGGEQE